MMKLGIKHISYALGSNKVDNLKNAEQLGKDASFIKEKIGFSFLRRLGKEQSLLDLCKDAYEKLEQEVMLNKNDIECIALVTQNPDHKSTIPHMSALLQARLGLPQNVAAFDMGLGCSGYVYGLNVLQAFMQANGMKKALLFTADAYSKSLLQDDVNTQLLFGDAVACTLITDEPIYTMARCCFATDGLMANALKMDASGIISMQGRDVFNFTARAVPLQIKDCLEKNAFNMQDVDAFILHQASKFVLDVIGQRLGLEASKIPFVLSDIGNCISSTIPIALQKTWEKEYKTILISGFGVGLSWASTLLNRSN